VLSTLITEVVGVVFTIIGVIGMVLPLRTLRGLVVDANRPAEVTTGVVGVHGTAQTATETVRAPVSEADCLGYIVEQQLCYGSTRNLLSFRRRWRREEADSALVSFDICGDAGRLRIDTTPIDRSWRVPNPDGWWSDVRLVRSAQATYAASEEVPSAVADRFETPIPDDYAARSDSRVSHRYVEWRLDPGREVYLSGQRESHDAPLRHTFGDELMLDSATTTRRELAATLSVRWLGAAFLCGLGILFLWLAV
jgi:hypothetical protein